VPPIDTDLHLCSVPSAAERRSKRPRLNFFPGSETIYKVECRPDHVGIGLTHATEFPNPNPESDTVALLPNDARFANLTPCHNIIAVDKTRYIESLDAQGSYQYIFLRPRRWGKTSFLHTLVNYYDKFNNDCFEEMFGNLYIGKHPTRARTSLLILHFDFSTISGTLGIEDTMKSFNSTVNLELKHFLERYKMFLGGNHSEVLDKTNATSSLMQVLVSSAMFVSLFPF
jgi:hypothetical protein